MDIHTDLDGLIQQAIADALAAPSHESSSRELTTASHLSVAQVAAMIDHTLLKPDAGEGQIRQLCAEAIEYGFASVCVHPTWVATCIRLLNNTPVKTCTVIGFPQGATLATVKATETTGVIQLGAQEVDMVLNVGRLKDRDYQTVYADIACVVQAAHGDGALAKVIIETALLTDEEKVTACVIAQQAGADFVKTSTGFNGGGATVADIMLMRQVVGPAIGVKASGGIRTAADARQMIAAGATRIGSSGGVRIVQEWSQALSTSTHTDAPNASSGDRY
ncbi:deoxyribose-phosphate aldolase [soil metagenome]